MREESKHQSSKQIANACKSRLNVSQTLSIGHSIKTYNYVSRNTLSGADFILGPNYEVNLTTFRGYEQFRAQLDLTILTTVRCCEWVTYHGSTYKRKEILKKFDPVEILFSEILEILLDDKNDIFCITHPIESLYDRHFQAHEVLSHNPDCFSIIYLHDIDGMSSKTKLEKLRLL